MNVFQELSYEFTLTTYPEFQNLMEFLEVNINSPDESAEEYIKKFKDGKFDALFLIEPTSDDFSYLCGWHWQTEQLIKSDPTTIAVSEMFGHF